MAMLWTVGAGLVKGDIICRQFGPDMWPIERIENLGEGRLRLHHIDGATSRTQSGARVRIIRPDNNK